MHSSERTIGSIGVILLLVLGLATALQAQDWEGGDVFLGNTGGKVVVFRPSTNSVVGTPLSDGVTNPGPITSLFIDNTWHPVAADPGASSNQSKIVRFSILPPQTAFAPFNASLCNGIPSSNVVSIAIDGQGNIFAANTNPPTLAELSPTGDCTTTASSIPVSSIGSIDLNTAENLAYFTSGDGSIRTVQLPLTSSPATVATFLSFNGPVKLFDLRVVRPVTNCGGGTSDCLLVVAQGTTNFCTSTLTGTSANSCVLLIDTSTKAVVAKYTISGQNNLQSLTLDPIVTDCTGQNCIPAKLNAFWVAGPSNQLFNVKIADGSNTPYTVTVPGGLSISSLFVYSGFGANQSIPTKFSGGLTTANNAAIFNFDSNTLTISEYTTPNGTAFTNTTFTIFAATIDPTGGSNDANQDCTESDSAGKCVVWEVENSPVLASDQFLSLHLSPALVSPGDANTRVFRDEATDVTISLDCCTGATKNSLYSLNEISGDDKGCAYTPSSQFFDGAILNPNRNSITFRFQCSGLPGAQLAQLFPRISIVQLIPDQAPAPYFPDLATLVGGTCCTVADYRYDTSANQWVINVSFKGVAAGTQFDATTFDDNHIASAFHINFFLGSPQ